MPAQGERSCDKGDGLSNQYRKRYHLLIEQDGASGIEQFEIRSGLVKAGLVVVVVLMLAIVAGGAYFFGDLQAKKRTGQLIDENQLLSHQLEQVRGELSTVESEVDSLVNREELLRLRVDLPPVDEDVREAGVGTLVPHEGEVIGDARVEELLSTLDHLERRIAVTRQSYEEIQEKILDDEQRLRHIPAIIPIREGRLTDGFGYRRDPFTRRIQFHYGADFSAPRGTPIYVTADGTVVAVKRAPGYGKMVEVDHGMGYTTIYGHLKTAHVRRGQRVERGELIAEVGNTGRSTAPHLHYEVQIEGTPVDPLDYFYEGYFLWANR
ncbi:MAG: Murein DD-endopeptidase MepM [Calditrichaeota bacterium]|nr:Murein DD-endopeptidase MepM [Calditrichota bacterium]